MPFSIEEDPWHREGIQRKSEHIKQRRAQMLIHSCIYYLMDNNVVDDFTWQKWADELAQAQKDFPHLCKLNFFDDAFKDWTGATGCHLPMSDPWVVKKALDSLERNRK